jgi:plastocyanin
MTSRSIRRLTLGGLLAAGLLATATGAVAADQTVDISGNAFSPTSVTVSVGDTVTWANADARSHTATADDGAFDTGSIAGNAEVPVTFTAAGTFPYHCRIHPDMKATIVVEAAAATAPPTDTLVGTAQARDEPPTAILLGLAALVGLAIARRRLGEHRQD